MKYRPEIDGLRTIAILPVLVYHLSIPLGGDKLMPGGYLGVDVFFVLSGYLIAGIILTELERTGSFDLWSFYIRRARRVLPALILVILTSLVAGYYILLPTEFSRLTLSAVAALGFVSNGFWFITLREYGAQSGLLQPLLHTWSLAIEEQFYLAFPFFLVGLRARGSARIAFGVLIFFLVVTLVVSEVTTWWKSAFSFFSTASRAWELLAGSVVAFAAIQLPARLRPPVWALWALPKLALATIIFCMFTVKLGEWRHPGLVTVPTILATCALIWCARKGETATSLLSSRPFVAVGKLSYSLYLWHFPIFAYGRLIRVEQPGAVDIGAWLLLTLFCAVLGYVLVERRLRFAARPRTFVAVTLSGVAAILTVAAIDHKGPGIAAARNADLVALYGGPYHDNEALQDQSWELLDALAQSEEDIGSWNASAPSLHERVDLWFEDETQVNILIVGNSHAKDLFNALHFNTSAFEGVAFARFGMDSGFPESQLEMLISSPNFVASDVIMIATRHDEDFEQDVPDVVTKLLAQDKRVVIVGSTPEFLSPAVLPIYDWFLRREQEVAVRDRINALAYQFEDPAGKALNSRLQRIARETGALYLSRRRLVCSTTEKTCTLSTPTREKTMFDNQHWTLAGAAYFGRRAAEISWLDSVVDLTTQK